MNTSHARSWEKSYIPAASQPKTVVKVKESGWITKGEKLIYGFASVCLIVASIFIVSYSSSMDSLNRDVQSLERKISVQQTTNENLQFEKQELTRPERITQIAREHGLTIQNAEVKQANLMNSNAR
ncbi:Cell division protein FtsL [Lentibacillus sp. JNUCC-1]|uniref:cell division protein FtsL n=1 Tax=Lentibacillus sp. JNUCC-1 TaxID=2654513 RepID=UPI0012E776B2|nr:cell division protein FtsL [Lentibacillus sp. JNUCC-1]MUV36228.1 Cell division protein FtsL [Lentibacillus sp. JNUCC-1]